ncbi:serine/threonine-protein kinase [Yinghuangia seranimata]|uniref:serine/threonine-protein kinase n=1 Tax=Yinghuangia seranimata TaxID=408067 RepID=UPI00248B4A03|nr:serine/threonine-protein kinase [Yinghuangia seranimata]MDI2130110.1 serine/threonine-protein kinase [Yinghuangia seranimata]
MRVLADRYELVRFIGRGGMGEVWEGRDRLIGRRVAVKLLRPDGRDATATALFIREANTAGALHHPGVVTVFDLGEDAADGTLFLVMEYVDGRDLAEVLRSEGPPAVGVAVGWAAQVAAALARAHAEGVVHRDLKPANLMLTAEGAVKILDFGIARFADVTSRSSRVIGTLAYMPPERFDEQGGDARSDLYSFGCVLYELLTGEIPFDASGPVAMMNAHLRTPPPRPGLRRDGVPAALDDLVLELLAKDPLRRPESAEAVGRRLLAPAQPSPEDRAVARPAATATIPADEAETELLLAGPTLPAPERMGRRRFLGVAGGIAAAVAVGGGITAAALNLGRDDRAGPSSPVARTPSEPFRPWRFKAGRPWNTAPVVTGGLVIAGSDSEGLHAVDSATGAPRWATSFNGFGVESRPPTVIDDVVYVGSSDNKLYAVDAAGGSELWFVVTTNPLSPAPAVAGETVFVGGRSDAVLAVDIRKRKLRWSFVGVHASGLVVSGESLYIAGVDDKVHALNTATGELRWTFAANGLAGRKPVVSDGVVYVGGQDGRVHAVDAAAGTERWSYTAGKRAVVTSAPAGGRLYVGAGNVLRALDAADGTPKWEFDAQAPITVEPTVAQGLVYVPTQAGDLRAVDAATGTQRWSFGVQGTWAVTPVTAAQSAVYFGTLNGTLFALDAATGAGPTG